MLPIYKVSTIKERKRSATIPAMFAISESLAYVKKCQLTLILTIIGKWNLTPKHVLFEHMKALISAITIKAPLDSFHLARSDYTLVINEITWSPCVIE